MNQYCDFCYHDEDLHEFGPDRRTPTLIAGRKYNCADCLMCEEVKVDA